MINISDFNIKEILDKFSEKGYCLADIVPDDSSNFSCDDLKQIIDVGYNLSYDPLEDKLVYID